jgi:predicted pyridoxine 5'-phosphate oxidase superfamily flavin-nucleotide-binding protein
MGHKFAEIAFTNNVKQVQSENNSRAGYSKMEQGYDANYLLGQSEAEFILSRDSFYMASVSETDWPYVQHRGGPKGFLKIIDEKTIGFADYAGNRQYISTGNFRNNDRVSLFLMDYPSKSRLKILGRISTVNGDDSEAISLLNSAGFTGAIERGFIIHIEAYDWNCPKYITPRYTEDQIENMFAAIQNENTSLKEKLAQQEQDQNTINDEILGNGSLKLTISGIRQLTPRVRAFELKDPNGNELPEVAAGSHIQVPIRLANGELVLRHYSICSNPMRRDIYEIAVLNEPDGKGGSKAIYEQYQLGQLLACQPAENYFPLQLLEHENGDKAILIAGGIGITPIKAMAQTLQSGQTGLKRTEFTEISY